ncbi:MAG: leucine-rich repeat domain-containing protein, partial [Myxococcales bacterium]|nr:leucine-rich repeat domain-containing protein [Myxococcales bacterium]
MDVDEAALATARVFDSIDAARVEPEAALKVSALVDYRAKEIGQLVNLVELELGAPVPPPDEIGTLKRLRKLGLSAPMEVVPPWLFELPELRELDLSNASFDSLPEELGRLQHLRSLRVASSELTRLPEALGDLADLRTLTIDAGQLRELPASIGKLGRLRRL